MRRFLLLFFLFPAALASSSCAGVNTRALRDTTVVATPDSLYSALLADHVHDGLVHYKGLRDDPRLDRYIHWLATTDPDRLPTRAAQLAFWINAYNAYTLKIICDNYPIDSINDLHTGGRIIGHVTHQTAWDQDLVVIHGHTRSLNDIEHGVIRPGFDDPRVHFALVCAAVSCPPLRSEAYTAERLDAQLDDQGRRFFADPKWNRFDTTTHRASLSKILDWYGDDFSRSVAGRLTRIAPLIPEAARDSILAHPSLWSVDYTLYDWDLNDTVQP